MDYSVFQCPKKIIYGKDTVNFIGSEAAVFGNKAMIVTGKHSSKKTGALDKVYYSLKDQGIDPVIFNKVESDPSVITVREGVKAGKKEKVDFIVALGGGSAMDAAKAISMVIGNGGDILDYEKVQPKTYGIPIIAVPTTAGTGSEVSKFSIITDTERKIKMLISSNFIIPEVSILDPLLTMMMPPEVTAATGMDAFTHAIEAYISKAAQPMSDTFAIKAIKIISSNISRSVLKGDIEAREKMLLGQMYAGLAFSNASTALVHSMSRPLGAYYKVPHGMANAILLTEVMKFNRASCAERFKVIAEAMGENVGGKSVREASLIAVDTIKSIFLETGLPVSLKEVGVDKDNFRKMAEDAMESKTTALNPRKPTVEQLVEIYEKIY
ncbi:iron-containing alcohol dehydrogenase family protein [Clostridium coskatii]|uniref:1,3-propanediol dehydrogenase n=1 Tax=Clostridium coskatii TaxID=1705578 RepID=A0A162LF43_9CLOT|nr:iron-containing alcohol dehydrogenase [Clostridium coskatii]OAA92696.1 1,3-propanediol dehydrogenase [Clostridium coskatii]OBR94622.1 1,3-propanediol dehydrogenase [Clostridium coskatii]